MLENLIQSHGLSTAISGMLIIYLGLIIIALVIHGFNFLFKPKDQRLDSAGPEVSTGPIQPLQIPEEDLIAITTAVELYRRLHFDRLESNVTFERGELHTGWKVGHKYGQRVHLLR